MADCYYHGETGPGSCPECIAEGRSIVFRGGVRITADQAADACALNERLRHPGEAVAFVNGNKVRRAI